MDEHKFSFLLFRTLHEQLNSCITKTNEKLDVLLREAHAELAEYK